MTPTTKRKSKLAFALRHAKRGRKLVPCHSVTPSGGCTCRKGAKCESPGKHPRIKTGKDHVAAATNDPDRIREWWKRWPDANIGIVTGAASNLIVVDVDDPAALAQLNGALPDTYTVRSHGDHLHLYYRHPGHVVRLDSEGKIAPGIHFRGDGGLVIGAGSTHASGESYAVVDAKLPVRAPDSLLRLLGGSASRNGAEPGRSDDMEPERGSTGASRSRHDRNKDVIVAMRMAGATTADIKAVVRKLSKRYDPPLPPERIEDELRMVEESAHWRLGHEAKVAQEVETQRVREEARVILARERAGPPFELPQVNRTLAVELDEPDAPLAWAVKGLHIEGFSTTIIAQKKTGKTRLATNLARSLADGEPFLDYFDVIPNGRRTLYMNYELMPRLFKKWVREVGIVNTEAIVPLHLQGAAFPFWTPELRPAFIDWLRANDIGNWIIDPAFRAWRGYVTDSNNNDQVGAFLYGELDSIKREAGISNLWLLHHIGKSWRKEGAEEGAAAHQFGAWEDATWVYTKSKDGKRALRAEGREVDSSALIVEEVKNTKRLTTYGERRSEVQIEDNRRKVLAVLDRPLNATALRSEAGFDTNAVDKTVRALVKDGCIERRYDDGTPVDESAPKSGVSIMHYRTADGDAELASARQGS